MLKPCLFIAFSWNVFNVVVGRLHWINRWRPHLWLYDASIAPDSLIAMTQLWRHPYAELRASAAQTLTDILDASINCWPKYTANCQLKSHDAERERARSSILANGQPMGDFSVNKKLVIGFACVWESHNDDSDKGMHPKGYWKKRNLAIQIDATNSVRSLWYWNRTNSKYSKTTHSHRCAWVCSLCARLFASPLSNSITNYYQLETIRAENEYSTMFLKCYQFEHVITNYSHIAHWLAFTAPLSFVTINGKNEWKLQRRKMPRLTAHPFEIINKTGNSKKTWLIALHIGWALFFIGI